MTPPPAFFREEPVGGIPTLLPEAPARSRWGAGTAMLRGPAVSGALARAAELVAGGLPADGDRRPARWTLDLFRPARWAPATVQTAVLREGRRLCLVEALLLQDGRAVARGTLLVLRGNDRAPADTWNPTDTTPRPPQGLTPASLAEPRLYFSESTGWSPIRGEHQNHDRKGVWLLPMPVVRSEPPTAFQQAAIAADVVNVVSNWGAGGLGFINADLTLYLARLPRGDEVGLVAATRTEEDGVAIGSAYVLDRTGTVGTVSAAALAQPDHVVDLRVDPGAPRCDQIAPAAAATPSERNGAGS